MTASPVTAAQVSALCASILRRRIEHFDDLPDDQRLMFIKDEAGHVADFAAALAAHPDVGAWLDGAPDGFGRWLVQALVILEVDFREGGKFT